jgi:uncharacterized membrane protein YqaE (UPF0057 family)
LLKVALINCCDSLNLEINNSLVLTNYLTIKETTMRLLFAIFLPFISFLAIGRPFSGLMCLLLQVTLIGWIPAAIWATFALSQYKTGKRIEKALLQSGNTQS